MMQGHECEAICLQHGELKEDEVAQETRDKWEKEQSEYRNKVITEDTPEICSLVCGNSHKKDEREFYIGGVDVSFIKDSKVDACSCLTVLRMSDLEVLMVDGNGMLHPRNFGVACHLGVLLDVPTLGVAKTLITAQGIQDGDEHKQKKQTLKKAGDTFDLLADNGTVLGRCLRTVEKARNPIYISVGHKISLESATWICIRCSKHRIPEPLRKADLDSREYLRAGKTEPYEFIKEQ